MVGILTVPDAFAATYTDPDNRFSIEYPNNWILGEGASDALVAFSDKFNWNTTVQVFLHEGDADRGRTDAQISEQIIFTFPTLPTNSQLFYLIFD